MPALRKNTSLRPAAHTIAIEDSTTCSLRRHYPDQVQRVRRLTDVSGPVKTTPRFVYPTIDQSKAVCNTKIHRVRSTAGINRGRNQRRRCFSRRRTKVTLRRLDASMLSPRLLVRDHRDRRGIRCRKARGRSCGHRAFAPNCHSRVRADLRCAGVTRSAGCCRMDIPAQRRAYLTQKAFGAGRGRNINRADCNYIQFNGHTTRDRGEDHEQWIRHA